MEIATYIGIDPGLTGAVAVIERDGQIVLYDTPTVKNVSGRRKYLPATMWGILNKCQGSLETRPLVAIENVHSMPKDGHAGAFSFGYGLGLWIGLATALLVPIVYVEPRIWKRYFHLSAAKGDSVLKATQLYPELGPVLTKVKDHNKADAVLLATFALQTMTNRSQEYDP